MTGTTDKILYNFFQQNPNDFHAGFNDFLGNPGTQIYTLPFMPGNNGDCPHPMSRSYAISGHKFGILDVVFQ